MKYQFKNSTTLTFFQVNKVRIFVMFIEDYTKPLQVITKQ